MAQKLLQELMELGSNLGSPPSKDAILKLFKLLVKKYTFERLAQIYRLHCMRDTKVCPNGYDWIPGKILNCFYDRDFRSDTVEYVLCETMFPADFNVKHRVLQWIKIFPELDEVAVKALEEILEQKQGLQPEMEKYPAFKQKYKDSDVPETQKKGMLFFRVLSRYFINPEKADESFQVLDQLKDANIWKILSDILDPTSASICQARSSCPSDYLGDINRCSAISGRSKRSWSDGGEDISSSDTPTSASKCPIGIKKSKRKGKRAKSDDHEAAVKLLEEKAKEKENKMYELEIAKEIRKREKQQVYERVTKMDLLMKLMSQGNLPHDGEMLKLKLFKDLADQSSS